VECLDSIRSVGFQPAPGPPRWRRYVSADGRFRWGDSPTSGIIAGAVANTIFQLLSDFFAHYGYWAVFFGVMLENIGLPIPGETVLLFAGFLAYQGKLEILPAILTAIGGATIGAALGYLLGHYGGTSIVGRMLLRFPRIAKRYEAAREMFLKRGHWAVFAARFITGLRVFAGILAGVMRMPFAVFLLYRFAGAVCWGVVIGFVGFLFGSSWGTLVHVVGRMDRIALAVIAGGAVVLFVIHSIRRRKLT
jgi:membrane protein DedA with SNARE-associated domain